MKTLQTINFKSMKLLQTLLILIGISLTSHAQTYPEMISVEGGTFTMGDEWMLGDEDEQPTHEVTLKNFKIGKTEVTVAQYRAFCNATGKAMPETPDWGWKDNFPIVNVSWHDAVAYCDWLSEKLGGLYRLPTEAEWEYAARGGNKSSGYKYSGSQSLYSVGWANDNADGRAHAVASKKTNELGIYDMSGNVWEWCMDWYDSEYYANSPNNNPRGPRSGSYRVMRGGSWYSSATDSRVAFRNSGDPSLRYSTLGFRVVLSQ